MAQTTVIRITHTKSAANWPISQQADSEDEECIRLAELFEKFAAGMESGLIEVAAGGTQAAAATGTWTAATASGTVGVAINGATGITVTASGGDTATATALAAAINASNTALVKNYIRASSSGAVVTITAFQKGLLGNAITLATSGAGTGQSVSGARLTGGAGDDVTPTAYNQGM